uniref:Flagellar motor switch protein FliN-like C-terminal domain-containing protein n=1 Tax=Glossina pallidipes TaxID=7398 RepID=A0A1A9Z0Y1_GLOPL
MSDQKRNTNNNKIFFGGSVSKNNISSKEFKKFTISENRIIHTLINLAIESYKKSWDKCSLKIPDDFKYKSLPKITENSEIKWKKKLSNEIKSSELNIQVDDTQKSDNKSTDNTFNQQETSINSDNNNITIPAKGAVKKNEEENNLNLILDIPIKMTIELGRKRMTIRDLLHLKKDTIVALDVAVGEPLDILINDYLIAQGEVVVMQEKYGIRISNIITPEERMRRLNK